MNTKKVKQIKLQLERRGYKRHTKNLIGKEQPWYVCGMSVPPVMMANVASNIYEQWLSKL